MSALNLFSAKILPLCQVIKDHTNRIVCKPRSQKIVDVCIASGGGLRRELRFLFECLNTTCAMRCTPDVCNARIIHEPLLIEAHSGPA